MARRHANDSGERRTEKVTIQLTPSERATLEQFAARAGDATLSDHCRRILFSDEAATLPPARDMQAVRDLTVALVRIGTNQNQMVALAHRLQDLPAAKDYADVSGLIRDALEKVMAL